MQVQLFITLFSLINGIRCQHSSHTSKVESKNIEELCKIYTNKTDCKTKPNFEEFKKCITAKFLSCVEAEFARLGVGKRCKVGYEQKRVRICYKPNVCVILVYNAKKEICH